jgi:hypothetical protein
VWLPGVKWIQLSVDVSAPQAVETRMRSDCARRTLKQITGMGAGAGRAYTCTNRELGSTVAYGYFGIGILRFALCCAA